MKKYGLILCVVCLGMIVLLFFPDQEKKAIHITKQPDILPHPQPQPVKKKPHTFEEMLDQEESTLSQALRHVILMTLSCVQTYQIEHKPFLTIIDYSLPSNVKRLWIFDLNEKKLLFHTYVAHGIKSGTLLLDYFSNKYNSKSSSIGLYKTDKAYIGHEGLSLKLEGLEPGFNDHAYNRSIVMHGGWYVEECFIQRYGRAGRSWGCPAIPRGLAKKIIHTIQDRSLFLIYYPSHTWFIKSKFLNCMSPRIPFTPGAAENLTARSDDELRGEILFVDLNQNDKRDEHDPVLVIPAFRYEAIFHTKAPVDRMLRRHVHHLEYIALNPRELDQVMVADHAVADLLFVRPDVIMRRGYYITKMNPVHFGQIKQIQKEAAGYLVIFEGHAPVHLKVTHHFIRWLGL